MVTAIAEDTVGSRLQQRKLHYTSLIVLSVDHPASRCLMALTSAEELDPLAEKFLVRMSSAAGPENMATSEGASGLRRESDVSQRDVSASSSYRQRNFCVKTFP